MNNRMDRSTFLIGAVVIFLCTELADFGSSNDDVRNSAALMKNSSIVINTVHDYLQGQEKRLAYLRKHIEDYSKDHDESIRQVARTLKTTTQGNLVHDDEEVKKDDNTGDLSHLSEYIGTKYEKLCSGEMLLPAHIQRKLKCRYVDHGNPFLKIAPFREEEAYLDPRIVVYHDVIFEAEIETFKRLSKPKLEPAKDKNRTTGEPLASKKRIAKNAFLSDYENKHLELLDRRVEHMTGLTVDMAEPLQIAYYDIGGLFLGHHDSFGKEAVEYSKIFGGDRMATVLFYMNDVAKGGGTAFTKLNFTIWPKKGSAVFWHNLKRNGEVEILTTHAACPVLSGTKWVATIWLHEVGQAFLRPCSLLENE